MTKLEAAYVGVGPWFTSLSGPTGRCQSTRRYSPGRVAALTFCALAGGCAGDDKEEPTACERYKRMLPAWSCVDPAYWNPDGECPTDGEIAQRGLAQPDATTLGVYGLAVLAGYR